MTTQIAIPSPYELMDAEDERQIIAELKGQVLAAYVYRFSKDGQQVTGLSKVGVDDACREMAKRGEIIRELELTVEQVSDEGALFKCRAGRYILAADGVERCLDTAFGVKYQRRETATREGRYAPNPFWWETGSMKAARNARRRLMPETLIKELIEAYIGKGKVQEVRAPQAQPQQPRARAPQAQPEQPSKSLPATWSAFWARCTNELGIEHDGVCELLGLEISKGAINALVEAEAREHKTSYSTIIGGLYQRVSEALKNQDKLLLHDQLGPQEEAQELPFE